MKNTCRTAFCDPTGIFLMNEVIENDSEPMISDSLIDSSQAENAI